VNRRGLTVFVHAMTGDTIKDHTDHVLWLGASEPISVSHLSTPLRS
jgi:DOPA 4,5-dioxygenase